MRLLFSRNTCIWGVLIGTLSGCSAEVDPRRASSTPPNSASGVTDGSGSVPGVGATGGAGTVVSGPGTGGAPPLGAVVGPTALRRLTDLEYRNTVQALLGSPTLPAEPLQPDAWTSGFNNFGTALTVPPTQAAQYADLAAKQAAQSFTPPSCAPPAVAAECAATFIADFGKRAFRRPLSPAEQQEYLALYSAELMRKDHPSGLRLVVETLLQSPKLVYRFELGDAAQGANRTLTSYEVSTELAYMLSASTPDAELLAAADADQLRTAAQIEQQARRLLGKPSARGALRVFLESFAGVARLDEKVKDPEIYPTFTRELKLAMHEETGRFLESVVFDGDGSLTTLMTAPFTFVNSALSQFYGVADPGANAWVKVNLDPTQRAGLLTQPSVLTQQAKAGESWPIYRGKFVRVGLLCQTLPPPPADAPPAPPVDPNLTTRERLAAHSNSPACSGCHQLIDPIGFGLENYDGIGRYRTTDNGKPVDASGSVTQTRDIDGAFTGGIELGKKLSASAEARECVALQAYRWTFGRREIEGESAIAQNIASQLAAGGLDIREAMIAITKSNSFLFRSFN